MDTSRALQGLGA